MTNNKSKVLIFTLLSVALFLSLGFASAVQLPVNLGTAGDFAILSKSGISTTGVTSITGDIGVSPIDHTAITGFSLIGDPTTDTFLTSALVTGKIYAANLVAPTPSNVGTSVSNMETAFTDAQGRTTDSSPEDTTELGAGDISGMTIVPGLHKWSSGVLINVGSVTGDPNGVTLDCSSNPNGVFIFQIAQDLTIGPGAQVTLVGGCQAANIFWAVDGGVGVAIDTTAHVEGIILASKAITLNTGATLNGRALSQTAVTMDANAVTSPAAPLPPASPPPSTPSSSSGSSRNSGGSGGFCVTKWSCTSYGSCVNGIQTRTCSYPTGFCTPTSAKPLESQSCTANPTTDNPPTTANPSITGGVTGTLGSKIKGLALWVWALIAIIAAIVISFVVSLTRKSH